jgi:hypothetical protein
MHATRAREDAVKWFGITSAAIGAFATVLAGAAMAFAAPNQVDGTQHFVAFGTEGIVYEMRGGLVGEWLTPYASLNCKEQAKTVQCRGEGEVFDGFLDGNGNGVLDSGEADGTLEFAYEYSASASGNGRCHHTIIEGSGEGGFENASGQLTFKDRLGPCGQTLTTYSGHISLVTP